MVEGRAEVEVEWKTGRLWQSLTLLTCGFTLGSWVQDVPRSRSRPSLGWGEVVEIRELGTRQQLLVDFPSTGQLSWLPYEHLARVKSVQEALVRRDFEPQGAERLRLRCLSHALEQWNDNTGALSRLEIDPLPHQINLVHHILASGSINWMIADDVGLGKTVEVGMLLHALARSRSYRRVLIVCPAGLTQQWQEELAEKFGLDDYLIYGRDFEINQTDHWRLYERVIASVDRLKQPQHLAIIEEAGAWDLVVFDEAHRLSRRLEGDSFRSSERYRLAASLRELTDSLLLLTATPHQGREDMFCALLELLRPDLEKEIRRLARHRHILHDMVVRNPKSQVTDWEGNLLFRGKVVNAVPVPLREEELRFGRQLQDYFTQGYRASAEGGGQLRAIGFVMTIYRKLAASSLFAIERALQRRLHKLTDREAPREVDLPEPGESDERFAGEWEEARAAEATSFFHGEAALVHALAVQARGLLLHDSKLQALLSHVIPAASRQDPQEKIVLFTEYRATQDYLAKALRDAYGEESVELLNGSLDLGERRQAIARFNDSARFLISTEAGGEGINLHHNCHTLVNYDLPWTPTRIVQRIGRLYRYGQERQVVVFNLHAPQTLDADIIFGMYQRIDQIVADLGVLGGEFQAGLEDEIFGQLAELVDLEAVLARARTASERETSAAVETELQAAREAFEQQRDLFDYFATTMTPAAEGDLVITHSHLEAFVTGMLDELDIPVLASRHQGTVLEIKLPEDLRDRLGYSALRLVIAMNRQAAAARVGVEAMDTESRFFNYLIQEAQSLGFGGRAAVGQGLPGRIMLGAMLRWQNDQGRRLRQEFALALVGAEGVVLNSREAHEWLLNPASDGTTDLAMPAALESWESAWQALDARLGEVANLDLHPENLEVLAGAAVATGTAV